MQSRPAHTDLLEAIAELLLKEVLPKVQDDEALAYKTLVSWNMLGIIGRELKTGEGFVDSELQSLGEILGEKSSAQSYQGKMEQALELNKKLAAVIRDKKIGEMADSPKIWNHLKNTLKDNLSIANPRFKTDG